MMGMYIELTSITIDQSPVNDEGLEGLGQIASLQELSLRIVPLHGRGLGHLKGLTKMRHFTLISPLLKDVQGLEQLDQIEIVNLAGRSRPRFFPYSAIPGNGKAATPIDSFHWRQNIDGACRTKGIGHAAIDGPYQ